MILILFIAFQFLYTTLRELTNVLQDFFLIWDKFILPLLIVSSYIVIYVIIKGYYNGLMERSKVYQSK